MNPGVRYVRDLCLLAATVGALLLLRAPALAVDPLNIVREFCRADGLGARLEPRAFASIAHLVDWPLEPAWDRVAVIRGYQIATPRQAGKQLSIDVTYTVVTEVSGVETVSQTRLHTRTFHLASAEGDSSWRILGPPPNPHVFESKSDVQAVTAALDPYSDRYLSNSIFVWKLLHETGWNLPYLETTELANASVLDGTETPRLGDLVFYFDHGQAYHVGFVEGPDLVVSATLNAGIRRTPFDAFGGDRRFMRLVGNRRPTDTPTDEKSITATPFELEPTPNTPAADDTER